MLDAVTETADESLTPTVDTSDVVETVTKKTTTPDPLIDQALMTPSPTPPDMDALAQQKENYVEKNCS